MGLKLLVPMAKSKPAPVRNDKYRAQLMLDAIVALQTTYPQHERPRLVEQFMLGCMDRVLVEFVNDERLTNEFRAIAREILRKRFVSDEDTSDG